MRKKSILATFIISLAVFAGSGLFAISLLYSQPSADSFSATVPAPPSWTNNETPPTPNEPIVSGDATDDGIIDSMDINALLFRYGKTDADYKVANGSNAIGAQDLTQTIKYWHCQEAKTDCPYK